MACNANLPHLREANGATFTRACISATNASVTSHTDSLLRAQHIQLTALEDRESVQVALSVVINALASGQMEARRATALLYGLQLASSNAASLNTKPFAADVVRSVESTPEGLDLAQPGATLEIIDYNLTLDEEEDEEDDE
jgi:hypothetical protein